MCGIAGWLGRQEGMDRSCIDVVVQALHHRGPDAHGVHTTEDAALIHTRLSIIDLSPLGAQPMANEDGTIWTIFNGELYNHHEIRQELEQAGHRFRGRSDTEIIPHLYEAMGAQFVTRLRGMFTIAVYDQPRKKLILARDRFGIKPLFYAPTDKCLAFASELNALRMLPGIDTRPNRQAIYDYAALFYIPAPETFYMGIKALQPGELLEADLAEDRVSYHLWRYHEWSIAPDLMLTLDEATEQIAPLLQTAVQDQLESDVVLGSLLSGGIDSSLVSTYAQAAKTDPLLTFNVRFADQEYDETWAAKAVAEQIHSTHQTLDMDDSRGTWDYVTSLLLHAGQPYASSSLFAVDNVSRLMRHYVTVALSGDGGDEAFGGYDFFHRAKIFAQALHVPFRARQAVGLSIAGIASPLSQRGVAVNRFFAHQVQDLANARDQAAMVQTMFVWVREREHRMLCRDTDLLPVRRLFEPQWEYDLPKNSPLIERVSAHMTEINTRMTLANDFLFKVDTGSMRNSLEIRVPMLDEQVFEFGLRLPHRLKMRDRVGKQVLRSLARRKLPADVANKPKWGFGVPLDKWVTADFKVQLRKTLLDSPSPVADYFREEVYRPQVEAFCEDRAYPAVSRMGIYQRALMLLSLHLFLGAA